MPYQDAPLPPMTPALREACKRAIHVLPVDGDGPTLRAGRAAMLVLRLIGYRVLGRVLSLPPLIWFVELGYLIVARNRVFFARFLFRPKKDA